MSIKMSDFRSTDRSQRQNKAVAFKQRLKSEAEVLYVIIPDKRINQSAAKKQLL